jgi:error-prone DNA polymerase
MLIGFPRHLSQHVGGFVIARGRSTRLVPVENAAMDGAHRDPVGQGRPRRAGPDEGRRAGAGHAQRDPPRWRWWRAARPAFRMQDIPAEDPATYDMICAPTRSACSRSRAAAQMSMLPRLRPRASTTW